MLAWDFAVAAHGAFSGRAVSETIMTRWTGDLGVAIAHISWFTLMAHVVLQIFRRPARRDVDLTIADRVMFLGVGRVMDHLFVGTTFALGLPAFVLIGVGAADHAIFSRRRHVRIFALGAGLALLRGMDARHGRKGPGRTRKGGFALRGARRAIITGDTAIQTGILI